MEVTLLLGTITLVLFTIKVFRQVIIDLLKEEHLTCSIDNCSYCKRYRKAIYSITIVNILWFVCILPVI